MDNDYPTPEQVKRLSEWSRLTEEIIRENPYSAISLIYCLGIIDKYVYPRTAPDDTTVYPQKKELI